MPLTQTMYFSRQVGDLYFNIVKIVNQAQMNDWKQYSEHAGFVKESGGVLTFQSRLKFYNNPKAETWVAYVSSKPVTDPELIDRSDLEMYVAVTTSENAPFTTHMGIQRVPSEITHKNISLLLHEFCAKFMHDIHPDKLFMINAPLEFMREIISKEFKTNGNNEAMYIYDENTRCVSQNQVERLQENIKNLLKDGKQLRPTAIPNLHLKEDILIQREKIASGQLFPNITRSDDDTVIIKDKYTGNEIKCLNPNDAEFDWFFNSYDLFSLGFGEESTPMICVDLLALATLTHKFD